MIPPDLLLKAARVRRGLPPLPMTMTELVAELRAAVDGFERRDDDLFQKSLNRFLDELSAVSEYHRLLMAAHAANGDH
jgi:hypothetical protein